MPGDRLQWVRQNSLACIRVASIRIRSGVEVVASLNIPRMESHNLEK